MSTAGFFVPKSWPWRMSLRRNLNLLGFGTKKCRVRELEKLRFRERRRLALYRKEPGRLQSMGSQRVRHD